MTNQHSKLIENRALHLTARQVENIMSATSYLNAHYGVPFDVHLVIAHECAGVTNHEEAARMMWLFFHRLRKWFRRRGTDAFYVYVHENGEQRGFHTHVLLHAGDDWRDLQKWLPVAVERLWGGPLPQNMLHIKRRRQRLLAHRILLQWIWVRYLLKGLWSGLQVRDVVTNALQPAHKVLRLRLRSGGLVRCRKRAGVSSSLGRRARQAAGYVSLFERGEDVMLFSGEEFRIHADAKRWAEVEQSFGALQV